MTLLNSLSDKAAILSSLAFATLRLCVKSIRLDKVPITISKKTGACKLHTVSS